MTASHTRYDTHFQEWQRFEEAITALQLLSRYQSPLVVMVDIENLGFMRELYSEHFIRALDQDLHYVIERSTTPYRGYVHLLSQGYYCALLEGAAVSVETIMGRIYENIQAYDREFPDHIPLYFSVYMGVAAIADAVPILYSLEQAYVALKHAESNKISYTDFRELAGDDSSQYDVVYWVNRLQEGLAQKTLIAHFQPVIDANTEKTLYHEVLLRLRDEKGAIISAGPSLKVAEEMELMHDIDDYVIDMVCDLLEQFPTRVLSMNLSKLSVESTVVLEHFITRLTRAPIGDRLIVEITETSIHRNLLQALSFITEIRRFGCRIALDDFGSGYTSFYQLQTLPLDIMKIDGSYIRNLPFSNESARIVERMVYYAGQCGMTTVAEFVETAEIARRAKMLGIDALQGFYYARALPYEEWDRSF